MLDVELANNSKTYLVSETHEYNYDIHVFSLSVIIW